MTHNYHTYHMYSHKSYDMIHIFFFKKNITHTHKKKIAQI